MQEEIELSVAHTHARIARQYVYHCMSPRPLSLSISSGNSTWQHILVWCGQFGRQSTICGVHTPLQALDSFFTTSRRHLPLTKTSRSSNFFGQR
jgi:hypothetical protein